MGSRDLGLVTIFFSNPRTHRSLRERPARFASDLPLLPLARSLRELASLASRANAPHGDSNPGRSLRFAKLELPPNFPRTTTHTTPRPITASHKFCCPNYRSCDHAVGVGPGHCSVWVMGWVSRSEDRVACSKLYPTPIPRFKSAVTT